MRRRGRPRARRPSLWASSLETQFVTTGELIAPFCFPGGSSPVFRVMVGPLFVAMRHMGEANEVGGQEELQELSEEEKRERVVSLAFGGNHDRYQAFCDAIAEVVPPDTTVVLRGSAVTGTRWKDGAPFDADGPGT